MSWKALLWIWCLANDKAMESIRSEAVVLSQSILSHKTQFETGISNRLVAVQPGGPRDEWKRHLFHGAYQIEGVMASQRPRYGALDLMRNADGPAPRFGSYFFIIKSHVAAWCTFMFGGSQERPRYRDTVDEMDASLATLMENFTRDSALGVDPAFRGTSVGQHLCEMASV